MKKIRFFEKKHKKQRKNNEKDVKIVVISLFFCNFTADFVQWTHLVSPAVRKIGKIKGG